MSYLHGVYTSEAETSVIPGIDAGSCIPFVIGTLKRESGDYAGGVTRVASWSEFKKTFSDADADLDTDASGTDYENSVLSFAQHWFKRVGGGEIYIAITTQSVQSSTHDLDDFTDTLGRIDTIYEQFGVVPTVVLCPWFSKTHATEIADKCAKFGDGWSCVGLIDTYYDGGELTPSTTVSSTHLIYAAPYCYVGGDPSANEGTIIMPSTVLAGAMYAADVKNGGLPYESPSNKLARIDGTCEVDGTPIYFTRAELNDQFNAKGIVTFWHTDRGWVVWGNNTAAYPGTTDPKDRFIPIRRTFNYVRNDFMRYAAPRVDMPINKRQLDGLVTSYNMRLAGFKGRGLVNSARVFIDFERSTPEQLLAGIVWVGVAISPPPPAEQIQAVFEYDVKGFTDSLS